MSIAGGPKVVRDSSLLLWLDAANNKSFTSTGTIWKDLTSNGYYGTFVSGPIYNSSNYGYISLTGGNCYVNTNIINPNISGAAVTYETVFKNNATGNYFGFIGASQYLTYGYSIGFFGQSRMAITYDASPASSFEPVFNYSSTGFSHGVFIFSGRSFTVYRNGVKIYTDTSMTFDAQSGTNTLTIGKNQQGGWGNSIVDLAFLRVYNRPLSQQEVIQNFNATKSRFFLQ